MKNKYYILSLLWALLLVFACAEDRTQEDGFLDETNVDDNTSTIQDGVEKLLNPYLSWVETYPGLVADSVYRYVDGVEVTIDGNYIPTHPNARLGSYSSTMTVWFNTGYYAAPGEVITITKPAGLNAIVGYRIGSTHCNLDKSGQLKRYPNIYTSGTLNDGDNRVYNYFGGHIYITLTTGVPEPMTFNIKGAVKAPDYFHGKTDFAEWMKELETTAVPFTEINSGKVIWTIPVRIARDYIENAQKFTELMEFYNDVAEHDFMEYSGLSYEERGSLHGAVDYPMRNSYDIQVCAGAAHSGYPAMYGGDTYAQRAVQFDVMSNSMGSAWGFFHELGHNFQTVWMWNAGEGSINEVNNNIHIFHSYTRRHGMWPEESVGTFQSIIDRFVMVDDSDKNFDAPTGTTLGGVINEDRARIIPFLQLAQKYGWKLMAYLGKVSRELTANQLANINNDRANFRRNYFCMVASEWAQQDLRPFFDAWGIKYTEIVGEEIARLPALDANDRFWEKAVSGGDIPSFEDKDTSGFTKLDISAVWKSEVLYDRSDWTVTTSHPYVADGTVKGTPESLIDGDGGSCLSLHKPGNTNTPAGEQLYFIVDMKDQKEFNFFVLRHRSDNSSVWLRLHEASLYGSNDGDNFTLIKSGIEIPVEGVTQIELDLETISKYRYVKLTYDRWYVGSGMSIQVAEFYIGYRTVDEDE